MQYRSKITAAGAACTFWTKLRKTQDPKLIDLLAADETCGQNRFKIMTISSPFACWTRLAAEHGRKLRPPAHLLSAGPGLQTAGGRELRPQEEFLPARRNITAEINILQYRRSCFRLYADIYRFCRNYFVILSMFSYMVVIF